MLCLSWCCLLVRFAVDDVLAVAVDVVIDIGTFPSPRPSVTSVWGVCVAQGGQ